MLRQRVDVRPLAHARGNRKLQEQCTPAYYSSATHARIAPALIRSRVLFFSLVEAQTAFSVPSRAIALLKDMGAVLVDVKIKDANICGAVSSVILGSESAAVNRDRVAAGARPERRDDRRDHRIDGRSVVTLARTSRERGQQRGCEE